MTEPTPWYAALSGPFPAWSGPSGVKADGGGCTRGRGTVGAMRMHRACAAKDEAGLRALLDGGVEDVNEVEAAGNTPLHFAAYYGWADGVDILLQAGAKVKDIIDGGRSRPNNKAATSPVAP